MGTKQSKTKNLNKKLQIRKDLLTCIPFSSLHSRAVVAVLLSYYSESEGVYVLMQKLSHRT